MRNSLIILLLCLSGTSCALIDLSEIRITSFPEKPEDILSAEEEIYIQFSEQVVRLSAESLFRLAGPKGVCEGSFSWDEDKMIFIPDLKLQPGFRYSLDFKGNLKTPDLRTFKKNLFLPFYYMTDELPPLLLESSPDNAENTGIKNPIWLSFSKAIDKDIFKQEFELSPSAETVFTWNEEGTAVTVSPLKSWINLQYYSWRVPAAVTDTTAVPVPKAYSGSFLVQLDTSPPALLSVHPAVDIGDGTFDVLPDLLPDELSINEHLALLFSEAVDYSSLSQCFSFDPAIEGYLLSLSPDCALYYINEKLPPRQEYALRLKSGLEDLSGNASVEDVEIVFTPAIPALSITSIDIEDQNGTYLSLSSTDFGGGGFIDTPGLNYYDPGTLHFIVSLSEDYPDTSIERRAAFESLVSLSAVFPPGVLAPELFSSSWENEDRLRLIYCGLDSFDPGEPVYYRFKISAGSFESAAAGGSYLIDNAEFTFLAEAR